MSSRSHGANLPTQPGGSNFHRLQRAWLRTGRSDYSGSCSVAAIKKRAAYEARVAKQPPLFAREAQVTSEASIVVVAKEECIVVVRFTAKSSPNRPSPSTLTASIRLIGSKPLPTLSPENWPTEKQPIDVRIDSRVGESLLGRVAGQAYVIRKRTMHSSKVLPKGSDWIHFVGWLHVHILQVVPPSAQENGANASTPMAYPRKNGSVSDRPNRGLAKGDRTLAAAQARGVQALRQRLGLTQAALASRLEVTVEDVERWENGSALIPGRALDRMRLLRTTHGGRDEIGEGNSNP